MYFNFQLSAFRYQLSASTAFTASLLCCFVFSLGCASNARLADHYARIQGLRNQLPYVTAITQSRSMLTVINPGTHQTVQPFRYDRLQAGFIAVYWPVGSPTPICHFVGHRIGTDSWSTHGMNQPDDLVALGYLLTRENYIGVIY